MILSRATAGFGYADTLKRAGRASNAQADRKFRFAGFFAHATICHVPEAPLEQIYSRERVLRLAGVSERQLRAWERSGLFATRRQYTLTDLKSLQTLAKFRRAGLGPKRIRAVFAAVRKKLAGISDPLTELTVALDHGRIHVLVEGQRMEPVSGQLLLNFDRQEISRLLAFPVEKPAEQEVRRQKQRVEEAGRWFQRGLELEQSGTEVAQAIEAYEKALELDPGCVGAWVNLGTIFYHAQQWKRAEKYYKRAIELQPNYALGHFNLANLYDERGDYPNAFLHYLSALRADPNYADAHYNLALLCQRTGQLLRAVRHWRTYLKLDPTSSWAEIARRELAKLRQAAVIQGDKQPKETGQQPPRVVS